MSALDKLAQKGNFTAIESVIYTYAMLERKGRGDGLSIASEKAADELAALQARIVELEKEKENAVKLSEMFISWGDAKNENHAFDDANVGYLVSGQEFYKLLVKGESDLLIDYLKDNE